MTGGAAAMPVTTYRGPTAKGVLKIDWDYPVYVAEQKAGPGETVSKQYRRALSRAEAVKFIAGDDPRPLLVLRECKVCNGTDDALLKGGMENEQTFLLATWFHCVKLPVDVMEKDHPFHNMFVQEQPEHLFVCAVDGSKHDPLESQTSRTELWDSMRGLLGAEYEQKPEKALKLIAGILDKMDLVDQRWNELTAKRDEILEEDGPDSRKLPKVLKDIEKLEKSQQTLRELVAKASELELKRRKEAAAEAEAFDKAKAGAADAKAGV
jgi:hypothetical protein